MRIKKRIQIFDDQFLIYTSFYILFGFTCLYLIYDNYQTHPFQPSEIKFRYNALIFTIFLLTISIASIITLYVRRYRKNHAPPESRIELARKLIYKAHSDVNQKYNNAPYSFHLEMVEDVVDQYKHLIDEKDYEDVLIGALGHDILEDVAGWTYNNCKEKFGETVAELIYALTNEKGKNRKERANEKYYREMKLVKNAVFLKLCDRIANVRQSIKTQSSMLNAYRREYAGFKASLKEDDQYKEMWDLLDSYLVSC